MVVIIFIIALLLQSIICKKLSQRIRNTRDRLKRKSTGSDVGGQEQPKAKQTRLSPSHTPRAGQDGMKVSDDEYKTRVTHITTEMLKPDATHVKMLLSESFRNRRP